ncbi:MAG TPA: zinc-dependent alcohol dehydrogenase family protein [Planctomycetota bacterium]|nr:zinc-dependent alcohol dehydrogenase family protein [Planctomycetota bacterium]
MRAMIFSGTGRPLELEEVADREPGSGEISIRVEACGVCRTDLHILDGELSHTKLPLILGHQIVGIVEAIGPGVDRFTRGDRVGVPWLASTCGVCRFCQSGRENLCPNARFTGYTVDGGFAELAIASAPFAFGIADGRPAVEIAPLLCAGMIGYRTLVKAGAAKRLGIYGFGAAAHILAQVAQWQGREVYAFTRPGDRAAQSFARRLGAVWAGGSDLPSPVKLEAAIIFAPAGGLVPKALADLEPGGVVVCGGIHMSDIPSFPYEILWEERSITSVANLTRRDGTELLDIASRARVETSIEVFALEEANEALRRLRAGELEGAAVLSIDRSSEARPYER